MPATNRHKLVRFFRILVTSILALVLHFTLASSALAQINELRLRPARLIWDDASHTRMTLTVSFRDAIDREIQGKLTRGLPTTILFTAGFYVTGSETPVGTAVQTCRVTWHVWEEAFRVEIARSGSQPSATWTTTIEGVLRRCGEARHLPLTLAAGARQGRSLSMRARVLVNPIGDELMQKIKRWVSRPTGANAGAPGDALFGTFTGFFMQHVGEAERVLAFGTKPMLPAEEEGD